MRGLDQMPEGSDVTERLDNEGNDFSKEALDKFDQLMEEDTIEIEKADDNGKIYKINGTLLPNAEYTEHGHIYQTDELGRIRTCEGNPKYTVDGSRNIREQKESGGEERQEYDDGGHIIAKILNGSEGSENLVPMRRTINRGDYKKMENEIARAVVEGSKVKMFVDITYEGDSDRPSKINARYSVEEGREKQVTFDNVEGSTDLKESLQGLIYPKDYQMLSEEIRDMREDGVEVSITSVKVEYDDIGEPEKVTVGVLDESTGEKTYKVYVPGRRNNES